MIKKIIKHIKFLQYLTQKQRENSQSIDQVDNSQSTGQTNNVCTMHKDIQQNILKLKDMLGRNNDFLIREFTFNISGRKTKACICFIYGIVDKNFIDENIIKPLLLNIHIINHKGSSVENKDVINYIETNVLNVHELTEEKNIDKVIDSVLSGNTALIIDGFDTALQITTRYYESRSIQQPETEISIRGSHEGFVENIKTNTPLLRRIIKNKNLVFESFIIGEQTKTDISIAYINGIANPTIIDEVKKRLNHIYIDSIIESGYLEQLIEDNPWSPFPTVGNSEKPDKVAAKLLEGRIAILCDGTPTVLTVPCLFVEAFQASEDYYSRTILSTITRIIRLVAFIITLALPAFYVAITTFHQEMIPTVLIITFAASREGVPFPVFLEVIISETIFVLLREAGIRMPRAVGSAVSIVGTLVIGQSAVEAGIIGAPMVIITALTAITSFIIPSIYDAIITFRFILILFSGAFGLFGMFIVLVCMLAHMCSLRSFGSPYMSPMAPSNSDGLKDSIIRTPLWFMNKRPKAITWRDEKRRGNSQGPGKPAKQGGEGSS
jgi:spore germination protein KA